MSIEFNIENSTIFSEVKIVKPSISEDLRGNIWTSYKTSEISGIIPNNVSFIHDKFSLSKKNVLRGIHGDHKTWKLVTCVFGKIFQVVVDLREQSLTYKKWESFTIDALQPKSILVPPGFGNAFFVLSSSAIYHYKLAYSGDYIDSNDQFTHAWNDKLIGIQWPSKEPILSPRDYLFSKERKS